MNLNFYYEYMFIIAYDYLVEFILADGVHVF